MADISGEFDPRFERLAELLSASLDAGNDVGASVSVTIEGTPVVDIWGGWVDTDKSARWESDTITNVWSTTKTMTSLCALMLVDRGQLDVYAPIAKYWPEFAANGKADITLSQVMGHTSGVSGWDRPFSGDDLYDWDKAVAMLAEQAPWWEPGSASGYHALNYGHLIGEVVRRITGRSLGTFFAEEVAGPLDADFHIGLAAEHHHRVSHVIPSPLPAAQGAKPDRDSPMVKTFAGLATGAKASWTTEWKQAEIGAANGHGNARSVAKIQAAVANGGEVHGVALLSPSTIDLIFDEQSNGTDLVLGLPIRFGVGYGLNSPESTPHLPEGRICRWGGWGGSSIIVDTDRRMTIAYMMNKMHSGLLGDMRSVNLIKATYAAVGS